MGGWPFYEPGFIKMKGLELGVGIRFAHALSRKSGERAVVRWIAMCVGLLDDENYWLLKRPVLLVLFF